VEPGHDDVALVLQPVDERRARRADRRRRAAMFAAGAVGKDHQARVERGTGTVGARDRGAVDDSCAGVARRAAHPSYDVEHAGALDLVDERG